MAEKKLSAKAKTFLDQHFPANATGSDGRDHELLTAALTAARLVKEPQELELMRRVNKASSDAHAALMRYVRKATATAGNAVSEQEFTAAWYADVMRRGNMQQAYLPIVAYGQNAATLHYNQNNAMLPAGADSFLLVDAGGEYHCYASDITRTYPVNGTCLCLLVLDTLFPNYL